MVSNLESMITYLKEAIQFQTAADIYELPREEFTPYVKRVEQHIPKAAIPYAVLILLIEEQSSLSYKIKRFFQWTK